MYADILNDADLNSEKSQTSASIDQQNGIGYELAGQDGEVILRSNRNIIDDTGTQSMTMEEIEVLKAEGTGSGKDLIAKIIESHNALDQKTAFALAKYTLRKAKKYLKRFTAIPLDVSTLAKWILLEKEPMKIMELREEMIALIGSWANLHYAVLNKPSENSGGTNHVSAGRWLVIDETGGLVVLAVAERIGLLNVNEETEGKTEIRESLETAESSQPDNLLGASFPMDHPAIRVERLAVPQEKTLLAKVNTITLLHANSQPNLSLLKYFNFDASNPAPSHPLYRHLKTISWLQLLTPEDDNGYTEPQNVSDEVLHSWKGGKRGNYHRKRRRWERIKTIVDETRQGGFDGLIVASVMNPATILHHAIPLLRGAAQVVIYSPTVEPLVELSDYYSTARRTAFLTNPPDSLPAGDFPVNPMLLLGPTIHTTRCKSWQVLPGRTHPQMTGRGGSEGYLFIATRVLPAEGKVEARGKFKRRKKAGGENEKTFFVHEDVADMAE